MPQETFRLLRASRNKSGGFTLVELLLVALILSVITGALFYTMNAGQVSFTQGSASNVLQSGVRRTLGWITKDVRQAVSWDMANNDPAPDYIKFRQVTGWDIANNTFLLSDYYVEYTYDAVSGTITRRTSDLSGNTIGSWSVNNIIAEPFFTRDSSGDIVALNQNDLLTSKQLIIAVSGSAQAIAAGNITYGLTGEVQIRNG